MVGFPLKETAMKRILCVLSVVGLLALAACGGPSNEPDGTTSAEKKPDAVIGVSLMTMTNPFFVELGEALKEAGAEHNFQVLVTSGEYNVANQMKQVDEFIVKQVNAIVLCPCDSRAIGTSIKAANKAGIPVFTADVKSLAEGAEVVCHVATDNLGGGRLAAEAVIEMLDGKGQVAVMDFPEVESVIKRTTGFKEVIAKAPDIKVVGYWPGGGDRTKSFQAARDILQSFPELDGFFAVNDPSGLGVAVAVKQAGKADRIKVVAFDAQPIGRRGVKDGELYATIVQYPVQIGKKTMDAIARYLAAEEVEPEILIPCTIYRKADADTDPTLKEEE